MLNKLEKVGVDSPMRVLALYPESRQKQLQLLPNLGTHASNLEAQLQVACTPSQKEIWELLPYVQ